LLEGAIEAEVLFTGRHGWHLADLVRRATRLKGLDWKYSSGKSPISMEDIAMHRGLTHLRITSLRAHDIGGSVDLPCLKHLEIDLHEESKDSSSEPFISTWRMPMLATLLIQGFAVQTTEDDIHRFLASSPPKLHILILTFAEYGDRSAGHRRWLPTLNILTLLPNLTLLGVYITWFGCEEAIQVYDALKCSQNRLPNILISQFYFTRMLSPSIATDIVRWWKFHSENVDYITIDLSWRQIARSMKLSGMDTSNIRLGIKSFLEVLLRGGVHFCDPNGSMLGDAESREFMLGLETGEFRTEFIHL